MRFLFGVSLFALAACSAQAPAPEQAAEPATPSELNAAHAETAAADLWLTGVDLPAYLDCAREQGVTLLQAHRTGDRPGAAENSIGAMQASLDDGALFLEMDVAERWSMRADFDHFEDSTGREKDEGSLAVTYHYYRQC